MLQSTISSLASNPLTKRELLLVITMTVLFTLIIQFDFASQTSPDGTRSILGHEPWSIGNPGGGRKVDQLVPDHPGWDMDYSDYSSSSSSEVTKEESFLGKLTGVNVLGSHGTVGRWREMTMNDSMVKWDNTEAPRTELVAHAPGWTILRNLYLYNGTWFIVTDEPSDFPLLRMMISTGAEIWNDEESIKSREPTDKDLKIIFPSEAKRTIGHQASKVEGTTWAINDPSQFLDHYYHFAAEALFGFWRTYSSLDHGIGPDGRSRLPAPRRLMFTRTDDQKWRDYSHMNTFLCKSVFPSMSYEFAAEFQDRVKSGRAYLYDRVVFTDRAAALRGPHFATTWRTAAEAYSLHASPYWWSPVRRNLLEFVGEMSDAVLHPIDLETPVITYVSRQDWGRRMLIKEDHEVLVKELNRLHDEHGYEVNIVSMDKLSRDEQIRLAARTTIMLGVHGNGLTHLLWMKPTPRATVIEFFFPQGFAHDYEFTSRALGIKHFGFWGKEYFTAPDTPEVAYPEGFQGNAIPLDGKVVAELIHTRLSIKVDAIAEGEVQELIDTAEEEVTGSDALDDENDPEFMDVEMEQVDQ